MVATLAQAASAAYYLESQRSFRHPNEYYTAGEEPDGVWFNPKGLFALEGRGEGRQRRRSTASITVFRPTARASSRATPAASGARPAST